VATNTARQGNQTRSGKEGLLPSAVEAIGHTRFVEFCRLTRDLDGRIVARLAYLYS
jgi:hypothetical protein